MVEAVKKLCKIIGAEFVTRCLFNELSPELDTCDLVIDGNRAYKRAFKDQKIVFFFTGCGDLTSNARNERQFCENIDFIILPKNRSLKNPKVYYKYKEIGNITQLYFEDFYVDVTSYPKKDIVLVPDENCFQMDNILGVARKFAEEEGLDVSYKSRQNDEPIDKVMLFLREAKYIFTGFSTMAFEGLYFNIPCCMLDGLTAKNITNNNDLFYKEMKEMYPEIVIKSHKDVKNIKPEVYKQIRSEFYNPNFVDDFVNLFE
jgi:hypothetical protein